MKKILSVILAAMMIVSCFAAFTITASAAQGDWNVYATRADYIDEYDPNNRSIPGYEYIEGEGLHMIPADYTWFTPNARFNTKKKVNLRDGVYMRVRIDDFTHGNDEWFGFYLNELQVDEFISEDVTSNPGMSALVRVSPTTREIRTVQANYSTSHESGSKSVNSAPVKDVSWNEFDDQDRLIFTFEVKWNEEDGYSVICNGIELDKGMMQEMTKVFDENDGLMYVGFALQNSNMGGTVECTILEFGTDAEHAEIPSGEDSADPVNRSKEIAEIADPSTVPAGQPAIRMDGYPEGSDSLGRVGCSGKATVLDNNFVNLRATNGVASQIMQVMVDVKYAKSYDVADFPIAMAVFRNLCTCTYTDLDYDGMPDEVCQCKESGKAYLLVDDIIQPSENYTTSFSMSMDEPHMDAEGNSYVYFIIDHSVLSDSGITGRINGIRMDIHGVKGADAERCSFDLCEIAYFRSEDEAEAYFETLMVKYSGGEETESETAETEESSEESVSESTEPAEDTNVTETETTEDPTEEATTEQTTEKATEKATEATTEESTDEPTEKPTEAPTEESTEKTTEADSDASTTEPGTEAGGTDAPAASGGCGGTVGIGALALVAVAAAGLVSFKKKED